VTFGTTADFLDHFGLESIGDLPGLADLKAAGLLEAMVDTADEARPVDDDDLTEDEDPLELDLSDLETADDLPDEEDDGAERSG
jgi:segregation and condensation protein B